MISEKRRVPVFAISCWVLGMMAFSQLLVAGLALADRFEDSKRIRTVIKKEKQIVVVRVPAAKPPPAITPPVVSRPPMPSFDEENPLPAPRPITTPPIADPRTERLVREAQSARVAGDMGAAVMKLEEALGRSPDEPNVLFELGLVHEQMGVFDRASEYYGKVLGMGVTGAGSLYAEAGRKLGEGFEQTDQKLGKLSLGRVRKFRDPDDSNGERVVVTIPVQKAPGEEIEDLKDLGVSVEFFNRNAKGEILPREDNETTVTDKWVTEPFDWPASGEEVQMTYTIPPRDATTEHLFGTWKYYGQIVTLTYKGEVLDVQADPPSLAARVTRPAAAGGEPLPDDFLNTPAADFDSGLLLPPLPER